MENKKLQALIEKANSGDAEAQYELGEYYEYEGLDGDAAFKWFSKSAAQGNMDGMYSLACCHEEGIGVEENYEKAFEIFLKMAKMWKETGHEMCSYACKEVSDCYREGRIVEKNYDKAMEWLEAAALVGPTNPEDFDEVIDYLKQKGADDARIKRVCANAHTEKAFDFLASRFSKAGEKEKAAYYRRMSALCSRSMFIDSFERMGQKMDYEQYLKHEFRWDLEHFYDIQEDRRHPGRRFCTNCSYDRYLNRRFRDRHHFYYFSSTVFFVSLFPQMLCTFYDWDVMVKYHEVTGYPQLWCSLLGMASPTKVVEYSGLVPCLVETEEYLVVFKEVMKYQLAHFEKFLEGKEPGLNDSLYHELCSQVKDKVDDIKKETKIQAEIFKSWIWDPSIGYKLMLVKPY